MSDAIHRLLMPSFLEEVQFVCTIIDVSVLIAALGLREFVSPSTPPAA